jgi:hypothetical protein
MKRRAITRLAVLGFATTALFAGFARHDVSALGNVGQVEGYQFILPEIVATPGEEITIVVKGAHAKSAQGFSFAARYPAEDLIIDRVHIKDSILEAIQLDYFEVYVLPEEGIIAVAALVDTSPPFEGALIPNIGFPLNFFTIDATIAAEATGMLSLQLDDSLLVPPVQNLFSVDNQAEPVTALNEGQIFVAGNVLFLRGDGNMDLSLDISDPILLLDSIFRGSTKLPCPLAADANDDESVDISDAIRTLSFLFDGAASLTAPFPVAGFDPTPSRLSCAVQLPDRAETAD